MIESGDLKASVSASSDDIELLSASGLIDEHGYRSRAGLSRKCDPIRHYLEEGWLLGLEPCDEFDGQFLRPYYEASGLKGPPALTWLTLCALPGLRPPTNMAEASQIAELIRRSPYFDSLFYTKRLGSVLDPAIHYAIAGELLGWPASSAFEPAFYLECNKDLVSVDISPLWHYTNWGFGERRRCVPAVNRLAFPPLLDNRPAVLLVVHEASRTGAPILGWNVARRLAQSYNVITVLMRGGELELSFAAVSGATVGPLVWEEWQPADMARIAARLLSAYRPIYAIVNSVETSPIVEPLAQAGVPSIALIHEFAGYIRPLNKLRSVIDWANHIVFPAQIVAEAAFVVFPSLKQRRGVHILSQGHSELPQSAEAKLNKTIGQGRSDTASQVRPHEAADAFVVLGAGSVQMRKGVDIFIATAAAARRLAPEVHFRFVWIGDGYDPINDVGYSSYLAEQILRSDLVDVVSMLDAVEDLDPAYASADIFLLSSRLDPQPNVGIDALIRGLPIVCFDGASGTAEILATDPKTCALVVPHLDAYAAAQLICHLAADRSLLTDLAIETARVAANAYDMEFYVKQIAEWGQAAAASASHADLKTLVDAGIVDADLAVSVNLDVFGLDAHRIFLQQWAVVGVSPDQGSNPWFRRPCAGFHPQVYAVQHKEACGEGGENPLAHWLRAGKPAGLWSRQVFTPDDLPAEICPSMRVALHAHFYYVESAADLAARLGRNVTRCDLFLTTDTQAKVDYLRMIFADHSTALDIRIVPNSGRDIGPFLTGLSHEISDAGYDLFGHLHGKQSLAVGRALGDAWRDFLWDNLVGGNAPMLDLVAAAFSSHPNIGLLIAEDPHIVGWEQNRHLAEQLAARIGLITPLDDFFDFPLGTMFWARPKALKPLLDLRLVWSDYPTEPLPYDGTLLHALERLIPFAVRHAGFEVAGLRAPGTTW